MRKFIRFVVTLLGIVVVLLIAGTIVLRMKYPPARLRELVETQIRERLNREAQVRYVQLGLGGLRLEDVRISEPPNFRAGTFLVVEAIDIHWALLPLLSKHVSVNSVLLQKPQLNVVRLADGKKLNVGDLSASAQGHRANTAPVSGAIAEQTQTPSAHPWTWHIDRFELRDGLLQFHDRSPAKMTTTLTPVNLTVEDLSKDRVHGQLRVGKIDNLVYEGRDLDLKWALEGIDPTLEKLTGTMTLRQGPGALQNLEALAGVSSGARVALMPLIALQTMNRLGVVKTGLPDFNHVAIDRIEGNYVFQQGTMELKRFEMAGPQLSTSASGTIHLPTERLALNVDLRGDVDGKLGISGTMKQPKVQVHSLKQKAFKATLKNILKNPKDLKKLKNLFN
jgi:uncharacterized protein YhdP